MHSVESNRIQDGADSHKETPSKAVEVVHYSLRDLQGSHNPLRSTLIETYQSVFRGKPWEQFLECTNAACGQNYSENQFSQIYKEKDKTCVMCNCGNLDDPHSPDKVESRLQDELSHDNTFLIIAGKDLPIPKKENTSQNMIEKNPEVTGFIWGFAGELVSTVSSMVDHYLISDKIEKESLIKDIKHALGNQPKTLGYISELGVEEKSRGGGEVAFKLIDETTKELLKRGETSYLFWTTSGKTQNADQKRWGLSSEEHTLMAGSFIKLDSILQEHYRGKQNGARSLQGYILGQYKNIPELSSMRGSSYLGSPIFPIITAFGGKLIPI